MDRPGRPLTHTPRHETESQVIPTANKLLTSTQRCRLPSQLVKTSSTFFLRLLQLDIESYQRAKSTQPPYREVVFGSKKSKHPPRPPTLLAKENQVIPTGGKMPALTEGRCRSLNVLFLTPSVSGVLHVFACNGRQGRALLHNMNLTVEWQPKKMIAFYLKHTVGKVVGRKYLMPG